MARLRGDFVAAALVEPLGPDEISRRLNGRLRPGPAWRRWTLVALRRRRLAALLMAEIEAARDAGDDAVVEVLGPVAAGIEALAVEPDDDPGPEPVPRPIPQPKPRPKPRPAEPATRRLVAMLRERGELRPDGSRWLSRADLVAAGFDPRQLRFVAARVRRSGVRIRATSGGYALIEKE